MPTATCLQITPASTNPLFTERKLWNVARVCGRDDQQGLVAAAYIAKNFKGKNIAILNDKTTYGKGLADETKKALNKAGITEKMYESYNKGDKDFNAIVSRLKLEKIDLVYVGGYHQEAGLILRQMRDQGLKTILMAGDALNDKEFASITGPAAEGTLFTFGPDPRLKTTAKAIVDKFKAKNIDPEGYTLYTYAAMQVWSQAVKKVGTHRSEEGHGCDQGERVGYGARQARLRRQGRHQADRLCRLQVGRQGQLHPDQHQGVLGAKFGTGSCCNTLEYSVKRPASPGRFSFRAPTADQARRALGVARLAELIGRTSSPGRNGLRRQTTFDSFAICRSR